MSALMVDQELDNPGSQGYKVQLVAVTDIQAIADQTGSEHEAFHQAVEQHHQTLPRFKLSQPPTRRQSNEGDPSEPNPPQHVNDTVERFTSTLQQYSQRMAELALTRNGRRLKSTATVKLHIHYHLCYGSAYAKSALQILLDIQALMLQSEAREARVDDLAWAPSAEGLTAADRLRQILSRT
ncbi:hypothetical protein BAUCODRAFT_148188 [Baudoinia panamericana UAMH 10762]|uniref:Uncharacterized protein n=1 Tax=Baudoinia panamericana (strain UAMH 10762) TaxID=717646 RepID=M2MIW8_BAUPA|nr:uncharacterized protein BAUCODRAFT_148188 [Baudoinia panamericana UAMH 10762]EMC96606.1 hypothetical protein BAUCODRAFT_148188 [Baudoinia panamericana UAMH 10762]